GPVDIQPGSTLRIDNSSALGTTDSGTVIENGGTLDVGGPTAAASSLNLTNEAITVSGAGVNGKGAIVNNGSVQQQNIFGNITLTGDTWFGGSGPFTATNNPGRWDIRGQPISASHATLSTSGNAYNLYKVGS